MPEPACYLCRLLGDLYGRRLPMRDFLRQCTVLRQVRCLCPGTKHRPLWAHDHRQPGCIGFTPPAIEVVGTVDTWEEAPHGMD